MGANVYAVGCDLLVFEASHPSTGAFAVAREEVGVNHTDVFANRVFYFKCSNVGVVYFYIVSFAECYAIKFCRKAKHAVNNIVEFEIGTEFFFAIRIFGVFEFV